MVAHALDKQLTIDQALTNDRRFGKKALNEKTVKNTWKGCLANEDELLTDWHKLKEVLVGIFSWCPPGRNWCGSSHAG